MTVIALPRRRPARAVEARRGWGEALGFVLTVVMLLIYSQGWETPLAGGGDESPDSALIRTLFLPAYACAIGLLTMGPAAAARGLIFQPFLIALMLIAVASLSWSVAPDQTARRIFALSFTTLSGVILGARYSWARLAEAFATTFAILAAISLFTAVFVPSIGRMSEIFPGAWRGLWPEKNSFGGNMTQGAVICAAAALLNPGRRRLWQAFAALCVFHVIMSTSKTSLVSLMPGAAALVLVWVVRRGPAAGAAATWAAVVGLGLIGGVAFFASDVVFGLLGKDATLTGRTRIWAAVMRQINERPWEGYGYGAIWDETGPRGPLAWITKDVGFRASHAHNSWLEQWLTLGVPGLAAWAGFYLQTLGANIVALYRSPGAYLALPFFVVFSLTSLAESIAATYNDLRWVIFVGLAVKLALPDPIPPRPLRPVRLSRPAAARPRRR